MSIVGALFLLLAAGGAVMVGRDFGAAANADGASDLVRPLFNAAITLAFFAIGYYFTRPWSRTWKIVAGIVAALLILGSIGAA